MYLTDRAAGGLIALVGGATLFSFVYRMLTTNTLQPDGQSLEGNPALS
jgi:hypothetical protein